MTWLAYFIAIMIMFGIFGLVAFLVDRFQSVTRSTEYKMIKRHFVDSDDAFIHAEQIEDKPKRRYEDVTLDGLEYMVGTYVGKNVYTMTDSEWLIQQDIRNEYFLRMVQQHD